MKEINYEKVKNTSPKIRGDSPLYLYPTPCPFKEGLRDKPYGVGSDSCYYNCPYNEKTTGTHVTCSHPPVK